MAIVEINYERISPNPGGRHSVYTISYSELPNLSISVASTTVNNSVIIGTWFLNTTISASLNHKIDNGDLLIEFRNATSTIETYNITLNMKKIK
jgi:hypothetical protein